jgi:hypothetical protein
MSFFDILPLLLCEFDEHLQAKINLQLSVSHFVGEALAEIMAWGRFDLNAFSLVQYLAKAELKFT